MRTLLLTSTMLACATSAFAADLPVKAPPRVAVAPFSWTGCYVGVHAGGAWGHKGFYDPQGDLAPVGQEIGVDTSGWLGGGQAGCNYQFASNWVVGIEGEFSWADVKGSAADPFFSSKNFSAKTESIATVAGRLGYTWDRWMLYGKGGAAWARDNYDLSFAFLGTGTASETRAGWIVGVGIEWAFAQHWSAKLEYDHYDFGQRTVTFAESAGGTGQLDVKQHIEAVKVGINYRF